MEMSYEDQVKLIGKMTPQEVLKVLDEAQFYGYKTEEYLASPCSADLRKKVAEREV